MEITETEDGEYQLTYKETPIGVVLNHVIILLINSIIRIMYFVMFIFGRVI